MFQIPIPWPWLETTIPELFHLSQILTFVVIVATGSGGVIYLLIAGIGPDKGAKLAEYKHYARFGICLLVGGFFYSIFGLYLSPFLAIIVAIALILTLLNGLRKAFF